jgi:uncharacterized membrane protein
MRKLNVFLVILTVSLISLLVLVLVGVYALSAPSPYPTDWWYYDGGSMGGMMGDGMIGGMSSQVNPVLSYLGVLFLVFVIVALVGIGGLVYFMVFPEIRTVTSHDDYPNVPKPYPNAPKKSYSAVYKTLKPDEKRVLDVLTANEGKYLQKYIRKDAGLSRLKVHRILARMAERGMVSLKKFGNTNEVILADWLKPQ